ncbi:MAG TPA: hypothetical protein P5234_11000 [Thermoanaerobaculaceae bacterium]|nr:hypothetical protein [Thermoanaerobaculaceae bacterium]HRS16757.1 hypothetical protein [Thermoanaerobaculaceae bacterium]
MHPLLVPGSWLVEGDYFPTGRAPNRVTGVTEVHSSEQFPETLRVEGEIRDAVDPTARPVHSTFHVDVVTSRSVRFRMDSLPLGTVLIGDGQYDATTLVLRYGSPDRRILGVETYVATVPGEMRTSGVLLVDGTPATMWLARLERVRG